jgi:hypothetical protein
MIGEPQAGDKTDVMPDPNLAFLDAELRLLWMQLENLVREEGPGGSAQFSQEVQQETKKIRTFLDSLRAEAETQQWWLGLSDVAAAFELNDFEQRLLLLAAAPELEEAFGAKIAEVQSTGTALPSVALAWRLFCPSLQERIESRDSLRDDAPLFRFRLLEMEGLDAPLPGRILRADRRIVDALAGRMMPDARVAPYLRYFRPSESPAVAPPAASDLEVRLAERIREILNGGTQTHPQLVVNCFGASVADLEAFAVRVCNDAGLSLLLAAAEDIQLPQVPLFVRESRLLSCSLFVAGLESQLAAGSEWVRWLACSGFIVFIGTEQALRVPRELESRPWLAIAAPRLDVWKRMEKWKQSLKESGAELNGSLQALADNFEIGASEIRRASRQAANLAWLHGEALQMDHVMTACRREVQHHMGELAQQLSSLSGWDDLLLPPETLNKLRELCAQVKCQHIVLDRYGFGAQLSRGRGVTALLAGPSGTGKTMAAEVVARDLQRDLYRVDLARVVSKYIGETEKNLRQVVLEAERARCVLLFDEADALFGRRTEVRDSHDRYANIEVSYLLQLIEETEAAVVLLTTNRREAIDEAFLRRFRFLIDFPLPDAEIRRKLWANSFPTQLDIRDVRFDVLADRLPLTGASVKNIALAATYLAASNGGIMGSEQIAHATRRELERMGRPAPFSDADLTDRLVPKGGSR